MRLLMARTAFILLLLSSLCSLAAAYEKATVLRIVDGDTLVIFYDGRTESIRLIGIDTPESKANRKAQRDSQRSRQDIELITAMGKEAAAYVRTIAAEGTVIGIEFDVQKRDKFQRLLAYAYLPNGQMLNEEIVKAGYAGVMTYPPNVKYQERFMKAYREAREAGRGLYQFH